MRFDVSGEVPGEWFKFFRSEIKEDGGTNYLEPEADAGRVCLRIASPEVIESIQSQTRKKNAEFVRNPNTRAMEIIQQEVQTPEQKRKEMEMFWDHAIKDWDENIQDKNGTPIPCTAGNKLELLDKSARFTRFAVRCLEIINEVEAGKAEDEIKNS